MSIFAIVTIVFFLAVLGEAIRGYRFKWSLDHMECGELASWPKVSIIVAARNEERNIANGVGSLLAIDYPELEVVAINDRSSDRTGVILRELQARDSRLQIVDINELPSGWLGKNHALNLGAASATGQLLLFTDADVIFHKHLLRRAVSHMKRSGLDHLTLGPAMITPTLPLGIFVSAFAFYFSLYARPWKARDPKSGAHIGIGAFNLVDSALYRRIGGHAPIAMRPDDDMKLGKLIKKNGGRQDFLSAGDSLSVEWYENLPQAIDGLMKNAFSGVEYSVLLLIFGTIFQLGLYCWPFVAIFILEGTPQLLNLLAVLVIWFVTAVFATRSRFPWWYALFFPITTIVFVYITWKATIRTLLDGGIRWRDTFYSLEELKANKV